MVGSETVPYGYMLWPMHGRSYAAEGIFGQYVFVDPDKNLVVGCGVHNPNRLAVQD
jgi:CubicO group peptidase (beta-lactamase class C family)